MCYDLNQILDGGSAGCREGVHQELPYRAAWYRRESPECGRFSPPAFFRPIVVADRGFPSGLGDTAKLADHRLTLSR